MFKKIIISILCIITTISLCGCNSDIQWFKEKDTGRFEGIKDDDLKLDTYYVKQGTKFYPVYSEKKGTLAYGISTVKSDRVVSIISSNENKIPSHYKGEGVAYKSNDVILSSIILERFKDMGYSIGLFNGHFDDTGYLYFDKNKCLVENSDLANKISNMSSSDIRIIAINGEKVTSAMVDEETGIIKGFEKDKAYTVQLYAGTAFAELEINADTHMLQSYEYYEYDNDLIDFTSNGYIVFQTPEILKSGYYFINGQGIFKYYDFKKGDVAEADVDMNESFYEDEKSMLMAQSKQYAIDVPTKVKDMSIVVEYDDSNSLNSENTLSTVKGIVFGPDETKYEMKDDMDNKTLSLDITEALPGEWVVNISPKSIEIKDVKVDSTKIEEEATLKEKDFDFLEDDNNVRFTAKANGPKDAEVYGYVSSPDGRTYTMEYEYNEMLKEGDIYCDVPYVLSGTWTVKIYYHPTLTDLGEIETQSNKETDTDIIIISE